MTEFDEIVALMRKYRALGYAMVVFEPEELRGVNPKHVEEAMIVKGSKVIDFYAEDEKE